MSHSVTCFQCRKAGFLKCVDRDMNFLTVAGVGKLCPVPKDP